MDPRRPNHDGSDRNARSASAQPHIDMDYLVVFNAAFNGMALTDFDSGRIIDVNTAWLHGTGFAREAVIGRTAYELGLWAKPDDRAACLAELTQHGRVLNFETCLMMRAVALPHLMSAEIVTMQGGRCILWEFRNIAEHKKAAAALGFMAAIVDNSEDAIVSRSPERIILTWNRAAERLFGYRAEEVIGRHMSMLIPPDRVEETLHSIRRLDRNDRVIDFETVRLAKDGRRLDVSVTASMIRDADGGASAVALIFRDITERKRKAALIHLLEAVARATSEATTPETGLRACLERICEHGQWQLGHLGLFSPGQQKGRIHLSYWHGADDENFRQFVRETDGSYRGNGGGQFLGRAMCTQSALWVNDFNDAKMIGRLRNIAGFGIRSGFVLPVFVDNAIAGFLEFFATAPRTPDEELLAVTNNIAGQLARLIERSRAADNLARLNAELETRVARRTAELEAANRELNSFSYTIAHDMRAPVRAINGFSELVLQANAEKLDEKSVQQLRRVVAGSRHLSQLIDDLLNLARLSRQEMARRPIDLSEAAAAVLNTLAEAQPARAVAVAIEPAMIADGDPGLMRAALENLIGNAWKYTAKVAPARIEIGTTVEQGTTVYRIRDNGAGFDMKYAHKLFAPFQRLHHGNEFEGTGIGLATVRKIIERHGGRIWIDSAVNAGTTVSFTLGEPG